MRRGHPGVGGWRGENQRHFRSRGSGTPNFRPSRPFGLLDIPRYPPPGPRQYRDSRTYPSYSGHSDHIPQSEHHDRNKYRVNHLSRSQDRGYHNRDRQMPPYNHQSRQNDNDHGGPYPKTKFYKNPNQGHINDMGDIDHRHLPWVNPPPAFDNNHHYYDDQRSPHKTPRHFNMGDDLPDYSGHRPPASDHYTTTSGPSNNNSQYSHSVDDTVDIIRKRLQNRDKQQGTESSLDHQSNMDEDLRKTTIDYQEVPQEQPVKKKIHRHKHNIKANCDKMKNKIVHQLFKMDKVKIHKLLDNPCSSNKFEYAISSLITEGQNSLNRHLRSVAEKSLCSSSTDFIQDDSNTIYEDTFMKQMQGVLDPQDTVLLEDIKPLVMAELSRVLQLDEYQFELMQDHGNQNHELHSHEYTNNDMYEHEIIDQAKQDQELGLQDPGLLAKDEPTTAYPYYDDVHCGQQFSQDTFFDQNQPSASNYNNIEVVTGAIDDRNYEYEPQPRHQSKPLFERRPASKISNYEERRQSRNSLDKAFGYLQELSAKENSKDCANPVPLFDPNIDQVSDEDDPFAEFDKQYHVAVDHNFIENENASRPPSPPQSIASNREKSPTIHKHTETNELPSNSTITSNAIKKEIDVQLQNIAQAPVKLFNIDNSTNETAPNVKIDTGTMKQPEHCLEKENLSESSYGTQVAEYAPHEGSNKTKETKKEEIDKSDNSPHAKSVLQSNTRKRSVDQKPSHRKEKRKRSSQSECQEAASSILNMFYANNDSIKDTTKAVKKSDSTSKTYSDKYVKRKEPHKKAKEKDSDSTKNYESKKHNNSSSSHSNVSPKDNLSNETPHKTDPKIKLKPIDIFGAQQPKKGNTHQAHRNTAVTPQPAKTPDDIMKPKPIIPNVTSFARKLSKRHVGTQIVLKVRSKECQTDKQKHSSKHTQTDPIANNISKVIASNPLERMKEIDMEIQLLLQEKFKLYNSLETKSAPVSIDTIPSLSMRVFKVNTENTEEKSVVSEDAIVDDFTNIPAEELEQIALETIEDEQSPVTSNKRNRRQKVVELARKSSASPTSKRRIKKTKSPNISLLEQIITDDRPIEDIISLDDLESTPVKSKKKQQKYLPKKKSSKKTKSSKAITETLPHHDIKECSVVLERIDINHYLRPKFAEPFHEFVPKIVNDIRVVEVFSVEDNSKLNTEECSYFPDDIQKNEEIYNRPPEPSMVQVVEDVVNDLQFDMLDVSEDIIIGDNCEVKADDKVKDEINEEIILDNSQSSMEEVQEAAGADNECKMYDYSTNENLRRDATTVTGNADAVLAIECIDNDFIAACLDGNVYHFNGDGQLLNTLRGTNQAVTCLTIVKEKYGTTIYTGSLDSRIRYYDLETGMEKGPECNVLSPIQTMDLAWDTVFVGTRTGFVLQFECKNNMLIPVSTVKFSEQSILALRAMKEGPRKVLLVAARSENVVTIKDAQTGLLLRTLQGPKMSVYTLLFEDGKVYCGTSSHNIHVFDYSSGGHVGSHEGGKGAVCLRASGGLLFAGCYDGCVYVYREGEVRALAQLRGPSLMLLSLAIRGTKIIAGYKDRGLYIWKMPLAIVQEMIL